MMNLRLYFPVLLVVLPVCIPLSAQEADEESQFYLGFAGSAVFPYSPKVLPTLGGLEDNFKAAAGFTAAFGYAFKEGFSTEMEWGYQKVRTDNLIATRVQSTSFGDFSGFIGDFRGFAPPLSVITRGTIENNREIKTHSLMGNAYYRYPKWRVSPYAGVGLGAFFHDGTLTSTVTVENPLGIPGIPGFEELFGTSPSTKVTVAYEDSRFAYQVMAGLSAEVSKLVEFRFGYRFRSSRGEPIDADQIEAGIRLILP